MLALALQSSDPSWHQVFNDACFEFEVVDQALPTQYQPSTPFRAFELPLTSVRVVILAGLPYSRPDSPSNGLAYSSNGALTPLLRNILKEAWGTEIGMPLTGDLSGWLAQGVLLLNSAFTQNPGIWDGVLWRVLQAIGKANPKAIYLIWGRGLERLQRFLLDPTYVFVGPAPQSPAFIGCGHFKQVNTLLNNSIDWKKLTLKWRPSPSISMDPEEPNLSN